MEETAENKEMFDESVSFKDVGVCDQIVECCTKLGYIYPTPIQR